MEASLLQKQIEKIEENIISHETRGTGMRFVIGPLLRDVELYNDGLCQGVTIIDGDHIVELIREDLGELYVFLKQYMEPDSK